MEAILIELAKLAAQSYFTYARLAKLSDIEARELFIRERERFKANDPVNLPDV